LTRLYDPFLRATLKGEKFKALLIEQAQITPGQRVLDLGCGTATLTIMVKRRCPDATVVGLDADAAALALERGKVAAAGVDVELHHGLASSAPFEPASFDRIVSSLLFHHLTTEHKRLTLKKARELLRPGGELHIADWGKPQNAIMRLAYVVVQLLDGFRTTSDNLRGLLVPLIQEAGFAGVSETHQEMTVFGTLSFYRAVRP
jgi:ubiquinone/menaquinone biosynthesis C-methylase UbiE